jgi:hypothetical protein
VGPVHLPLHLETVQPTFRRKRLPCTGSRSSGLSPCRVTQSPSSLFRSSGQVVQKVRVRRGSTTLCPNSTLTLGHERSKCRSRASRPFTFFLRLILTPSHRPLLPGQGVTFIAITLINGLLRSGAHAPYRKVCRHAQALPVTKKEAGTVVTIICIIIYYIEIRLSCYTYVVVIMDYATVLHVRYVGSAPFFAKLKIFASPESPLKKGGLGKSKTSA